MSSSYSFPPCKLCGVKEASCKAHIIPRQFYHRMRKQSPHLEIYSIGTSVERSTTQSGIWERGILCAGCDGKLGQFDDYAYKVLPATLDARKFRHFAPRLSVYELGNVDVEKFQWFLVALAWRAAVARHPLFRRVKLGPYEERFRNVLLKTDLNALSSVAAVVCLFRPPNYDEILPMPHRSKYDGVNVIQFYLYPWKLLLKVDQQDFASPFDDLALAPNRPATAFVHDFLSREEIRNVKELKKAVRQTS